MTTYSVSRSVFFDRPWRVEVHDEGVHINTLYFQTREEAERWVAFAAKEKNA